MSPEAADINCRPQAALPGPGSGHGGYLHADDKQLRVPTKIRLDGD